MTTETTWTTEIKPRSGWFDINLSELWRYRDLIMLFVKRDFVSRYKQTILGPLWFILQPVFSTAIFTVIFHRVAHIPTDTIPPVLFYMCGTVAWSYFATSFTATSNTFVTNAYIFGKVYFPRLVMPVSTVITNALTFAIQFGLFLIFYFFSAFRGAPVSPSGWIFYLPLILVQMALLGLGFGILVSSLTTKYRDLVFLVSFGIQLWMYATPVVYPLSQIPERYRLLVCCNPMTMVLETFRLSFFGQGTVTSQYLTLSWAITIGVLAIGILLFSRIEKTFMDTV